LVLRLMASFILYYTSRVICKGQVTLDEMVLICNTIAPL
jgi:hypothetical protein